ncbi:ESCRT-II complex vps25 subunit [Epithele typhae]|uniref:ESCRT-II complex vps25 subunit n=1 Tax=Epithele typhae TaxID=378194 RepID=UPI0020073E1F|nr:ESCRT-II complex vps25 subunit [Epithele typhae]KAH9940745.1 ESCRT-II complex vps25 subunit [Epithele typhae]
MSHATAHTTASGFLLPSIHSAPPFFTRQPNPATQKTATQDWERLILTYARHRNLFVLRVEDADAPEGSPWDEILRNPRINRRMRPAHLAAILADMVAAGQAIYDPPGQTHAALLCWRTPEEWAQILHDWATATGHLNTIMTLFEIVEPEVPSALAGLPLPLLHRAIAVLARAGRAQTIAAADGEGVRFLQGAPGR